MTMRTASLLVELFVEELPPKSLAKLGSAFGAIGKPSRAREST